MYKVPYIDLIKQYEILREEILDCIDTVFQSGRFCLGENLKRFETEMANFLRVDHVIGVKSCTDAMIFSMKSLGIGLGDEVITVAHTFVATIGAIIHCGANPVLIDIGDDYNMDVYLIEAAITSKTKAILPVNLNGRMCDMDVISQIALENDLFIIEDSAQSIGAKYNNQSVWGNTACFSLHPVKVLSVPGDGGFVATNDPCIDKKVRLYRDHGQETKDKILFYGYESCLDEIHAAIALLKLRYLPEWIAKRREIARKYNEYLHDIDGLELPIIGDSDVCSSYVLRYKHRHNLREYLRIHGIETFIHWKVPVNLQMNLNLSEYQLPKTEVVSNEVLSLPIYPELTDKKQDYVIEKIKEFVCCQ